MAAGIARDSRIDPERFGAHDAFELATIAGAEAVGMADRIGSIEPGKQADLVVHRASGWGWTPRGDVGLQLVWGTDGRSVRDVWVARPPGHRLRHQHDWSTNQPSKQPPPKRSRRLLARAGIDRPPPVALHRRP